MTPSLKLLSFIGCLFSSIASAGPKKKSWTDALRSNLNAIEQSHPEKVGVYLKNISTGEEVSFRGDEFWYVASGTKIPIAIAAFQAIDAGRFTLASKVEVLSTDYIDGAGELNYIKAGSLVSFRLLLDQSLTFSDNTATDVLLRKIGLENVNALTKKHAPNGFKPITSLLDVRRQVFGEILPEAAHLSNMDYIRLKVLKSDEAKIKHLSNLLKVDPLLFKRTDLDGAFNAYYAHQFNSATLKGYGLLLEKLARGELLKPDSQKRLLEMMERIETGKRRLQAGFPESYVFAHKTGTQHRRICDMGILRSPADPENPFVVVACVKNETNERSELILRKVGRAIHKARIFTTEKEKE